MIILNLFYERQPLPKELETTMDQFQKIIILKSLRPDKVTNAMQDFISIHLGSKFIEPQTTDLQAMFKESGPSIPLIFVLSTGTDPAAELYKFAERMKFGKRMFSISLGQGQGPRAEQLIMDGVEVGSWVFFQVVLLYSVNTLNSNFLNDIYICHKCQLKYDTIQHVIF